MKSTQYVAILGILNAMLLCYSNSFAGAAEGKGANHRGGRADSHMSSKGMDNTNAQWSADPERGWIRAEERHELHGQGGSEIKSKQNHGKQKGQGSKGKKSK